MTHNEQLREQIENNLIANVCALDHVTGGAAAVKEIPIPGTEHVMLIGSRAGVAPFLDVAPASQAQAELTDANELREIAVILEREGYRMNAMKLRQIALRSAAGSTVRESLDVASLRDSYEQSQGAAGSAYPAVAGPVGQVVDIDRNCNESIINIALEPGTAIYLAAQSRDDVRSAAREQTRNEALEEAEKAVLALVVHINDFPERSGEQEAYNEALESSIAAIRKVRNRASACAVPPTGWVCTRAPGHNGPCAAIPAASKEGDAA